MDSPKAQKKTIRVSGVLRTRVTYAVPNVWKTSTGDTRMTATTVPMMQRADRSEER